MLRKHYSHIILIVMLAASFGAGRVSAQTEESKASNSLKEGSWALQFQISNNLTLTSFQGTAISGKYQSAPNSALRFGISIGIDGSKEDVDYRYFAADTMYRGNTAGTSRTGQNIQIDVQYHVYPNPEDEVNLYFGFGPLVSLSRATRQIDDLDLLNPASSGRTFEQEGTTWSFGASGLIGAEWFASRRFSLHAEYGLSVRYSTETVSEKSKNSTNTFYDFKFERTSKRWQISGNAVKFGLSVYF